MYTRKLREGKRRSWKLIEREGSLRKHMEVSGKRENSPSISKRAIGKAARSHRQERNENGRNRKEKVR